MQAHARPVVLCSGFGLVQSTSDIGVGLGSQILGPIEVLLVLSRCRVVINCWQVLPRLVVAIVVAMVTVEAPALIAILIRFSTGALPVEAARFLLLNLLLDCVVVTV